MGRRRTVLAAIVGVLAGWALCAQIAGAASEGGPVTRNCTRVNADLRGPCRGVEQVASAGTAACRWAGAPDPACTTPVTPRASEEDVTAFHGSWIDRALRAQYELGNDVGLRNAPWIGTHNSFNSTAEMGPTLSDTDANQQLSLTDQLRIDVRSLELDVHWFPSAGSGGSSAPVVCHAEGNHAGCSVEKQFGPVLDEIGSWLREPENRDQVLLLYVEDHLDSTEGYDAGAAAVNDHLGDLVYRPSGPGCTPLPLGLTRDQVLAAGAQVVIVSGCGAGSAWPGVAFDWSGHKETRPQNYSEFPTCGQDYDRATYDSTLVRYFEDSTGLTAGASLVGASETDDGITPETAAQMARCGVDLLGMDQLLPGDGRLRNLVWSWAPGQPAVGDCAVERVDSTFPYGRWQSRVCSQRRPAACRTAAGSWMVSGAAVTKRAAAVQCRMRGARLAVPRTGYEAQQLRVAMQAAGVTEAWLGYHRAADGSWVAEDSRG
jgi:hypothetical protein